MNESEKFGENVSIEEKLRIELLEIQKSVDELYKEGDALEILQSSVLKSPEGEDATGKIREIQEKMDVISGKIRALQNRRLEIHRELDIR